MAELTFKLVLENRIREGEEPSAVNQRLAALFRVDAPRAAQLLQTAAVVKRGLTAAKAERYRMAIEQTGALCRLEPEVAATAAADPKPVLTLVEIKEQPSTTPAKPAALSLDKPLTPEPAAAPLSKCPKCGHQARRSAYVLLNDGKCPACGVVLAESEERKHYLRELPSASIKARILASLYTFLSSALLFCPIIPVAALVATIIFNINLSQADRVISIRHKLFSNAAAESAVHTMLMPWGAPNFFSALYSEIPYRAGPAIAYKNAAKKAENAEIVTKFLFGSLVVFYVIVLTPLRNSGRTRGQEWADLTIVDRQGRTEHSASVYIRRLFGHLFATAFLGFLLPIFNSDHKSCGDLFSGTTQVQENNVPTQPRLDLSGAWGKSMLAGFVAFLVAHLIVYLGMPTATSTQSREEAQSLKEAREVQSLERAQEKAQMRHIISNLENAIGTLVGMQQSYYKDTGHYADDIESLLAYFQKNDGDGMLDSLKMRSTPGGFVVGVHIEDGRWLIATDKHGVENMRCNPINKGLSRSQIDNCNFTPAAPFFR